MNRSQLSANGVEIKPGYLFTWVHGRGKKFFTISEVFRDSSIVLTTQGVYYHFNEIEIATSTIRDLVIEKIIND